MGEKINFGFNLNERNVQRVKKIERDGLLR